MKPGIKIDSNRLASYQYLRTLHVPYAYTHKWKHKINFVDLEKVLVWIM